jgi:hypothetical protein
MIIHNIVEEIGDDPRPIAQFNGLEDVGVEGMRGEVPARMQGDVDDDELYRAGLYRRKQLLALHDRDFESD